MALTYDAIFAVDPANPANVAKNASITIFDPADATQAPIAITDPTGSPLPNPMTLDAAGMGPAFQHPTLARVGWKGAGFTGYFTSYEGMYNETMAAKDAAQAAESAAATAGADAAAVASAALAGAVSDAEAAAGAAANAAALVGAPADTAIAAAVNGDGATKAALSATILDNIEEAAADPVGVLPKTFALATNVYNAPLFKGRTRTPVQLTESGHGFILQNGVTAQFNDTTDKAVGKQSIWYDTQGAGANAAIRKTGISPAINAAGKDIGIWVKFDNVAKLANLTVHLFTDGATASWYTWGFILRNAQSPWAREGQWTFLTLSFQDASVVGTPTRSNITGIQILTQDNNTGGVVRTHFNGVATMPVSATFPNGVVSIAFDDSFKTADTLARPVLDTYGYPATAYQIVEQVGTVNRLSVADLQRLQNASGWEIALHANTNNGHDTGMLGWTTDAIDKELVAGKNWMTLNGFAAGAQHLAYPLGQFDEQTLASVRKLFTSARTITSTTRETMPPADRHKLRCVSGISPLGFPIAQVQTMIDNTYTHGGHLILLFHTLVAGTAAVSTEISLADFTTLMAYINTKGIPVRTVGQALAQGA